MKHSPQKRKPGPSVDQPKKHSRPILLLLAFIALVAACILIYGRTSGFGTTGFDDYGLVFSFSEHHYQVQDAFTHNAFMLHKGRGFYRPLQSLSFMLDAAVFKGQVPGYHLSSIQVHCLAVGAIFWLLLLLGIDLLPSFFATLIFSVHPLFAQAVSWIPGRGDLLLGLCGTLAFGLLITYQKKMEPFRLVGHGVAFFCALLAKESAVVLPLLFALYLLLCNRKRLFARGNLILFPLWAALVALFFAVRSMGITGVPSTGTVGLASVLQSVRALPELLGFLVMPFSIPLMPSFSLMATLCGVAVIVALGTVLAIQRKLGRPLVIIGAAWYLLLSIPGMLYRHELGSNAYDYLTHRSYLPMVGILMLLVEAVPQHWYREKKKQFSAVALVLALFASYLALGQSAYFADPMTFSDQAVKTNPQSALALNNRGGNRHRAGNITGALADYKAALALKPNYQDALVNCGNALGAMGRPLEAIATLSRAIAIDQRDAHAFGDRGLWEGRAGDTAASLADYGHAIALDPTFAAAYSNRGEILAVRADYDHAAADFQAAIDHDPGLANPWFNLGIIRLLRGDNAIACSLFTEADRRGNPKAAEFLNQYCRHQGRP